MIKKISFLFLAYFQATIALADAPLIWGPNNTAKLLNSGNLVAKNGYIYPNIPAPFDTSGAPFFYAIPFATGGTTLSDDGQNLAYEPSSHTLSVPTKIVTSVINADIIGIGTTSPAGSLDVESGSQVLFNNVNVGIGTTAPIGSLDVESGGPVLFNNINVGISTNDPVTKLQVNDHIIDDDLKAYNPSALMVVQPTPTSSSTLNDPQPVMYLGRQGTSGEAYGALATFSLSRYENDGPNARSRLDLLLTNENFDDTNVMTIQGNGNIGIGTTAPVNTLNVASGRVVVGSTDIGDVVTGMAVFGDIDNTRYGYQVGQDSTHNAIFGWNAATTVSDAYTFIDSFGGNNPLALQTSGGNVGIGPAPPLAKFDVVGKFLVDSNGNILKVNDVDTNFPSSQGAASTVLENDGAGNLTWVPTLATTPNIDVTTTYTATAGTKIMTDSSGAAFTITLPASASFGDEIEFFDGTESWGTNNVTLDRNGLKIDAAASNFILNFSGGYARLKYYNATQGWRVYL